MDCFYDKKYSTTRVESKKNTIGQIIKKYVLEKEYKADIQPIDEKSFKYIWGNEIKSNLQMFCDENLQVNDLIVYNNTAYRIEKKVPWDDYNMYALLESDVSIHDS